MFILKNQVFTLELNFNGFWCVWYGQLPRVAPCESQGAAWAPTLQERLFAQGSKNKLGVQVS